MNKQRTTHTATEVNSASISGCHIRPGSVSELLGPGK